jgi:hypothetical protein
MNISYQLLRMYSFYCETYAFIINIMNSIFDDMQMLVLDQSFVEIYFYEFHTMKKHTLRNNTNIFRVLYLIFLKLVLGYTVCPITMMGEHIIPLSHMYGEGVFEFIYYTKRQKQRYYTKTTDVSKQIILKYLARAGCMKFMHATISDKYNVTSFINDHISSFHPRNNLYVSDVAVVLLINQHAVPPIYETDEYYLKVIDDNLEETIFKDNTCIVLTRDEC